MSSTNCNNKVLIVLCDGTANDGLVSVSVSVSAGHKRRNTFESSLGLKAEAEAERQYATNVLRLCRAITPTDTSNPSRIKTQIVHYMSGVGAESDFYGEPLWETNTMVATGKAVASKIRDAYNFLAQNYAEGDEIALFGFSRGAYTARKVAGLIDKIGLLPVSEIGLFFRTWRSLVDSPDDTVTPSSDTRRVSIKCLGVWDTVGSVFRTIDILRLRDDALPGCVEHAFHALALHEDRDMFLPTVFTPPSPSSGQELVQVWFPGAHADVGGGYQRHELADISLFWMAGEIAARNLLSIDLNILQCGRQPKPDKPWGNTLPHDTYAELPGYQALIMRMLTRLEAQLITSTSTFHSSFLVTPVDDMNWPADFVTYQLLKETFTVELRRSWVPDVQPLNAFEQLCKDHWYDEVPQRFRIGEEHRVSETAPVPEPTIYESESDLFPSNEKGLLWVKNIRNEIPDCDIIQGGVQEDGQVLFIARVRYADGLYPGKTATHLQTANICYGGKELINFVDYEILTGPMGSYQWVEILGPWGPEKMENKVPVTAGYKGNKNLFIAQASVGGGVHCGWTHYDTIAHIPWGGSEFEIGNYSVLAYSNIKDPITEIARCDFRAQAPKPGNQNSQPIKFLERQYPPSIAVGINKLECDLNKTHYHAVRFTSYTNKTTKADSQAHVDAWGDSTLNAAGLDCLITDEPTLQVGVFDTEDIRVVDKPWNNVIARVNFPIAFSYPPQVVVALSGLDISINWNLRICASNVNHHGFNMNITTMGWAPFRCAAVTWIAFPQNAPGIWAGSFGTEESQSYKGHVNFGVTFSHVPKIFTAFSQFEFTENTRNLSVEVVITSVTQTGMDWQIRFPNWPDVGFDVEGVAMHAGVSYLAMDLQYHRAKKIL